MTIGWDRQMVPPGNYTEIPEAQVAVRSWDDILAELEEINESERNSRRQLSSESDSGSLVWFANMTDRFYERLKLLDALEVSIMPDDPDEGKIVEFEWDILGYDNNYIWLQLYIKNPWDVAADGQFDTI